MLFNFTQASVSREENKRKLDAVQADAMKRLEKGVSHFAADTQWRASAMALVREAVIDTFRMTDPTPIFTERRDGKMGDTYEFEKLVNTLRVVEYSPQSKPQIFTPRKAKWTIASSSFEQAFGIPLQKVINGQHTIGEFADMAAEAVLRHYVSLVLTAVNTACFAGSTDLKGRALRTTCAGADVAKSELDAALRRMSGTNAGLTIYGSRYALDPIFGFAGGLSEGLAEELNQRGVIGRYRGARIVEIKDDYNEFYGSFTHVAGATGGESVDVEKLLFIASDQPGAVLLERDLSQLAWEEMDQRAAQWSSGVRFDHGILVHTPSLAHVLQLA